MVTLPGTATIALLLPTEIRAATDATLFNDTVHVLAPPLLRAAGAQASDVICAGALAVKVKVFEEPFKVLVSRAV